MLASAEVTLEYTAMRCRLRQAPTNKVHIERWLEMRERIHVFIYVSISVDDAFVITKKNPVFPKNRYLLQTNGGLQRAEINHALIHMEGILKLLKLKLF